MNKPYYNIPESIELTMVRNFTIYLQDEGYSDYSLVISKPENRPTWPQQGETSWQSITDFKTNPDYNENEAGRMEWANRIGQDRDYIEIEYKVKINTLRPDLTPEDSELLKTYLKVMIFIARRMANRTKFFRYFKPIKSIIKRN